MDRRGWNTGGTQRDVTPAIPLPTARDPRLTVVDRKFRVLPHVLRPVRHRMPFIVRPSRASAGRRSSRRSARVVDPHGGGPGAASIAAARHVNAVLGAPSGTVYRHQPLGAFGLLAEMIRWGLAAR